MQSEAHVFSLPRQPCFSFLYFKKIYFLESERYLGATPGICWHTLQLLFQGVGNIWPVLSQNVMFYADSSNFPTCGILGNLKVPQRWNKRATGERSNENLGLGRQLGVLVFLACSSHAPSLLSYASGSRWELQARNIWRATVAHPDLD